MSSDRIYVPRTTSGSWSGRHTAWKLSGKAMGVLVLLLLLASLIGSFYLNQASQTTAAGLEILRLTRQREYWRQENAELRKQIAQMESLSRIRARAEELGFVEPETVEYLVVSSPALESSSAESSPRPAFSGQDSPQSATPQPTDWWDELAAQFESWME